MRKSSITLLVVTILASAIFAVYYTRTVHKLVRGGLETGDASFLQVCFGLRNQIQVAAWKAFPQTRAWAHDGVSLFLYGDAPEGTKAVFYFPSWYLLMPLAAAFGFATIDVIRRTRKRTIFGCDSCC